MNIRLLGPPVAMTINVNGRSYAGAPGNVYDVPEGQDSESLGASGFVQIALSGPTSARPTPSMPGGTVHAARAGVHFLDTSIAKLIVFDGATWGGIRRRDKAYDRFNSSRP